MAMALIFGLFVFLIGHLLSKTSLLTKRVKQLEEVVAALSLVKAIELGPNEEEG